MKKVLGSRGEIIVCEECGSNNVVKKGRSRNKFSIRQIYKCKDCNKRFVSGFGKSYPAKIIMDNIIFQKIFRHLQLYKHRYHKAKLEFFANGYFKGLNNYLANVSENCPDELFKDSSRSSRAKLNIDAGKIKIFKKENYACRLASLALESANTNYERHDKLQEFMISNDTCTIATEVPVYLYLDEIKEYGVLDLFGSSFDENSILKIQKFLIPKNANFSITNSALKERS